MVTIITIARVSTLGAMASYPQLWLDTRRVVLVTTITLGTSTLITLTTQLRLLCDALSVCPTHHLQSDLGGHIGREFSSSKSHQVS
jgi:hypothetical protein